MRVLVTGSTGLVGSHVIEELERRTIPHAGLSRSGEFSVDLLDPSTMDKVPWKTFTHVIHAAAAIPARMSNFDVNTVGTLALLDHLPTDLQRFILVSSINASSDSSYGRSKLAAEEACLQWGSAHDVSVAIFRPTSIFGASMAAGTILDAFVRKAKADETLTITAPRDYQQNFIWARDVARVLVDAIVGDQVGVWELSSNTTVTALELAQTIVELFGGTIDDQRQANSGTPAQFDNRALMRDFNVEFTSFEDALRSSFAG